MSSLPWLEFSSIWSSASMNLTNSGPIFSARSSACLPSVSSDYVRRPPILLRLREGRHGSEGGNGKDKLQFHEKTFARSISSARPLRRGVIALRVFLLLVERARRVINAGWLLQFHHLARARLERLFLALVVRDAVGQWNEVAIRVTAFL
jgi:hypothetical protein